MAWHRVSKAPGNAGMSRAWLGQDDTGRTALLREVPQGLTVTVETGATPGIVWLREVVVVDGVRMSVWDVVDALSLGELTDLAVGRGTPPALSVVVRIIVDAAAALARVKPPRAHGGLSDDVLLVDASGQTHVMDFGLPRPSRFSPPGTPSLKQDALTLAAVCRSSASSAREPMPAALEFALAGSHDGVASLAKALSSAVTPATTADVAAFVRACRGSPSVPTEDIRMPKAPAPAAPIPQGTQPGSPPGVRGPSEATEPRAAFADTVLRPRMEPAGPPVIDEPFGVEKTVAVAKDFDTEADRTVFAGPAFRPPSERRDDRTVAQRPSNVNAASLPDFSEDSGAMTALGLPFTEQPPARRAPADTVPTLGTTPSEAELELAMAQARRLPADTSPVLGQTPSEAELEWAKQQVRVNTPPVPLPLGASDDELEPVGTGQPTRRARASAPSPPARDEGGGPSRLLVVVAALLVCLAIGFAVLVWKHRPHDAITRQVTPVRIDADAGSSAVGPLATSDDAGAEAPADASDEPDDEPEDAGAEPVVEPPDDSLATADAGPEPTETKQVVKKKKKKKVKRRRR